MSLRFPRRSLFTTISYKLTAESFPFMSRPFLSVIIPAYNEASRLPLTLIDIDRNLASQDFESEIIVVISQSTDATVDIVKRFSGIIKNIRAITLSENLGRGFAVKTGILAARGQWRLVMDADNSTTITELAKMIPFVTDKANACDIAIGSRFIEGAQTDPVMTAGRLFRAHFWQFFVRTFLVKGIIDTSCGFKLFSAESAEAIFRLATSNGWALDTEALVIARQKGYGIKEIPVFWAHDPATHRSQISAMTTFSEHFKIFVKKVSGAYKKSA